MSKANKVEVQKGKIVGNPPTMKNQTYEEKSRQDKSDQHLRRRGQSLDLHEPKTRKK